MISGQVKKYIQGDGSPRKRHTHMYMLILAAWCLTQKQIKKCRMLDLESILISQDISTENKQLHPIEIKTHDYIYTYIYIYWYSDMV